VSYEGSENDVSQVAESAGPGIRMRFTFAAP
jgi:hypothetical protein